jgi:hypothetical protein
MSSLHCISYYNYNFLSAAVIDEASDEVEVLDEASDKAATVIAEVSDEAALISGSVSGVVCWWGWGGPLPFELLNLIFARGTCLLYFCLLPIAMLFNSTVQFSFYIILL